MFRMSEIQRMRTSQGKKAEYVQKLEGVFMAIDEAGDGMISEEKLTTILTNPKAGISALFGDGLARGGFPM